MQTFLPFPDFSQSAKALSRQHLGKQRLETLQIFRALTLGKGWVHHPATKMWQGFESSLLDYGKAICLEWIRRGYKDSLLAQFKEGSFPPRIPPWLGDPLFHESHRSNLMRKRPDIYHFDQTRPLLPYQWPVLSPTGNDYYLRVGRNPP